jgi:hypothetical protein
VRGEGRLISGALRAGAIAMVPAVSLAWIFRGTPGALGAATALAIVVANLAVAGLVLFLAARFLPDSYPMFALPSYVLRMLGVFGAMAAVRATSSIDPLSFAITFAVGLVWVLAYECVLFARTPWLALEFMKERP